MMSDQGRPDQKLREFERDQARLYHELSQLELKLDSLTRQKNGKNLSRHTGVDSLSRNFLLIVKGIRQKTQLY